MRLNELTSGLAEAAELAEMARDEGDDETLAAVESDLHAHEQIVESLEFRRMFAADMAIATAFVDIQAGSGGTEAQAWADSLLRMYLRWIDRKHFHGELI